MVEELIQKYGKQLINELINMMMISGKNIKLSSVYDLIVEHKVITRRTKIIRVYYSHNHEKVYRPGRGYCETGDFISRLAISNYRGKEIIVLKFKDSELSNILEVLSNENENTNA